VSSASLGDKPGTGSAKPSIVRGFRRESSITIDRDSDDELLQIFFIFHLLLTLQKM
jgi:hypothetical protein